MIIDKVDDRPLLPILSMSNQLLRNLLCDKSSSNELKPQQLTQAQGSREHDLPTDYATIGSSTQPQLTQSSNAYIEVKQSNRL